MTFEEVKDLLADLRVVYPAFYRELKGEEELRELVEIWGAALAVYDREFIMAGFIEIVRQSRWAPTVAELVEAARQAEADRRDLLRNYRYRPLLTAMGENFPKTFT